jgi:hypothetical protein
MGRLESRPNPALIAVPTLDDLAADPGAVEVLSNAQAATLMIRALTVAGTLQARVMRQAVMDAAEVRFRERVLSTADVAEKLNRSISWIEKNLDVLPPRRALAGSPGWREADINDWIRNLPRY